MVVSVLLCGVFSPNTATQHNPSLEVWKMKIKNTFIVDSINPRYFRHASAFKKAGTYIYFFVNVSPSNSCPSLRHEPSFNNN